MNAERMHSVAAAVREDQGEFDIPSVLKALVAAYTQSVHEAAPEHVASFENALEEVRTASDNSYCAELSPSRIRILERLGGGQLFGPGLILEVERIIAESLTPSNALQDLENLEQRASTFANAMASVITSFKELGVDIDLTPEDSAEVEVLLPNELVQGDLSLLVREVGKLDRALSDIEETVTGHRAPLRISGLGSGSVEIILNVDLQTGAQILVFVTSVIQLMTTVIQSRAARGTLEEQHAPEKTLRALRDWESQMIDGRLEELRDEILSVSKAESERTNELRTALKGSLRLLADRIDRGMSIDVATAADASDESNSGEDEAGEAAALSDPKAAAVRLIHEKSAELAELERPEQQVLKLETGDDSEADPEGQ